MNDALNLKSLAKTKNSGATGTETETVHFKCDLELPSTPFINYILIHWTSACMTSSETQTEQKYAEIPMFVM